MSEANLDYLNMTDEFIISECHRCNIRLQECPSCKAYIFSRIETGIMVSGIFECQCGKTISVSENGAFEVPK